MVKKYVHRSEIINKNKKKDKNDEYNRMQNHIITN